MADLFRTSSLLIIAFLLSSCLTSKYELTFDQTGRGSLKYSSSISTLAADMEKADHNGSVILFPLMRSNTEQAALQSGGVLIASWEMNDDGSRYHVDGEIVFDDFESLSAFSGIEVESIREGANSIFSLVIRESDTESAENSKAVEIVRNSFSEDYIEIQTTIPGDIIRVEGATFTGSVVTFRTTISNLLESEREVGFSVEYR